MTKAYFKTSVAKAMRDPISCDLLETCLLLVDTKVPRELICRWSVKQRAIGEDWAIRLHLRASDNNTVRVPQKPDFVTKAEKSKLPHAESSAFTKAVLRKKGAGTLHEVL